MLFDDFPATLDHMRTNWGTLPGAIEATITELRRLADRAYKENHKARNQAPNEGRGFTADEGARIQYFGGVEDALATCARTLENLTLNVARDYALAKQRDGAGGAER